MHDPTPRQSFLNKMNKLGLNLKEMIEMRQISVEARIQSQQYSTAHLLITYHERKATTAIQKLRSSRHFRASWFVLMFGVILSSIPCEWAK